MFAEENRGKEIKERIQKDLKPGNFFLVFPTVAKERSSTGNHQNNRKEFTLLRF